MSTEPKSNHRANVVRIAEVLPHPNADTLGLVHIGGYQAVVKLGDFKPGDLAVYIQPDSVVPEIEQFAFLWQGQMPPIPEKRRRVTVRRFRKEYSEGLLLPLSSFPQLTGYSNGDDAAFPLGITHYEPPEPGEPGRTEHRRPGLPRSLKGWGRYLWYHLVQRPLGLSSNSVYAYEKPPKGDRRVYDVEAYKNYKSTFRPGEIVVITEKIHGSNARYTNDPKKPEKIFAGSRQWWKSSTSGTIWNQALLEFPVIAAFLEKNPGITLYGEVVPTQKGFDYGATKEKPKFFLFDILDEDGRWVERFKYTSIMDASTSWLEVAPDGVLRVPVLYVGPWSEDLVAQYVDGPSMVSGANHMREGIVIRALEDRIVRGLGRPQLKVVSNKFLEAAA